MNLGRLDLINVPYEKAKLNSEIESFERKVREAMANSRSKPHCSGKNGVYDDKLV